VASVTEPDLIAQVRAIWEAFERGGVEALEAVVGPDVEWIPLAEGDAARVSATVHGYEEHGPCVLAHGSLRTFRASGFVDVQPSWVYLFRAGRLIRAAGYPTREAAMSAISAYRREA